MHSRDIEDQKKIFSKEWPSWVWRIPQVPHLGSGTLEWTAWLSSGNVFLIGPFFPMCPQGLIYCKFHTKSIIRTPSWPKFSQASVKPVAMANNPLLITLMCSWPLLGKHFDTISQTFDMIITPNLWSATLTLSLTPASVSYSKSHSWPW